MKTAAATLIGFAVLASGAQAHACRGARATAQSILHREVPATLPPGVVVLGATMGPFKGSPLNTSETWARVHIVLKGSFRGRWTRVIAETSCGPLLGAGETGYLIGRMQRRRDGSAILIPIHENLGASPNRPRARRRPQAGPAAPAPQPPDRAPTPALVPPGI